MNNRDTTTTEPAEPEPVGVSYGDGRKRRSFTWFYNDIALSYLPRIGTGAWAVYTSVLVMTDGHNRGPVWPSHKTLAERIGISERAVATAIAKLVEVGLMKVTPRFVPDSKGKGKQTTNHYEIIDPDQLPPPARQKQTAPVEPPTTVASPVPPTVAAPDEPPQLDDPPPSAYDDPPDADLVPELCDPLPELLHQAGSHADLATLQDPAPFRVADFAGLQDPPPLRVADFADKQEPRINKNIDVTVKHNENGKNGARAPGLTLIEAPRTLDLPSEHSANGSNGARARSIALTDAPPTTNGYHRVEVGAEQQYATTLSPHWHADDDAHFEWWLRELHAHKNPRLTKKLGTPAMLLMFDNLFKGYYANKKDNKTGEQMTAYSWEAMWQNWMRKKIGYYITDTHLPNERALTVAPAKPTEQSTRTAQELATVPEEEREEREEFDAAPLLRNTVGQLAARFGRSASEEQIARALALLKAEDEAALNKAMRRLRTAAQLARSLDDALELLSLGVA